MDKSDYTRKLEDHISNGRYSKVKKDPTMKTERKLSQILIKNQDHFAPKTNRQLSQRYTKLPHIYGLPKIHKDGIPQRPIVSCQGSVCHPLSRFLVDIIDPLIGKSPSYVRNSSHFVEIIKDAPILSNQMVSSDVVSLFTKVPREEALSNQRQIGP